MEQAIADSGLTAERDLQRAHRPDRRRGRPLDPASSSQAADTTREKGSPKRIGPFAVPKAMSSGPSAVLATWFKITRRQLFDLLGLRDLDPLHRRGRRADPAGQAGRGLRRRLRGAGLDPVQPVRRHGRHVVQLQRHARRWPRAPTTSTATASSSPAAPASWCWKSYERAKARGAKIYAEIVGYAANSDGYDMVAPSGEGAERCMKLAMDRPAAARSTT